MGLTTFVGRLLFAAIFLSSAWSKASTFGSDGGPTAAYMAPKVEAFKTAVASATGVALDTVPLSNAHLLVGAIIAEGAGGLLFIVNSRLGARLLLLFLVVATPIMHAFWDAQEAEKMHETVHFFKNLSLAGALLFWLGQRAEVDSAKIVAKLKAH